MTIGLFTEQAAHLFPTFHGHPSPDGLVGICLDNRLGKNLRLVGNEGMYTILQSHAFGGDFSTDAGHAGSEGHCDFSFDARSEAQRRNAEPYGVKQWLNILDEPVHHNAGNGAKRLDVVGSFTSDDMKCYFRKPGMDQWPDFLGKPEYGIRIGTMCESA